MQESRPLSTDCGRLSSAYLLFLPRPPRWLSTAYWVALKRRNIHNQLEAHHNIDGYLKSSFFNTYLNYKESIEKNASRFRAERNIDRCLFSLDPVYNGASIPKLLYKPHHWQKKIAPFIKLNLDSLYAEDTPNRLKTIEQLHPALFCVNSAISGNIQNNKQAALKFYKRNFPFPLHLNYLIANDYK